MISVLTKNLFIYSRQEVWFYNGEKINAANNTLYYLSSVLPQGKLKHIKEVQTTIINLQEDANTLFKNLMPNYRNEIRRAEKKRALFNAIDRPDNNFLRYYIKSYYEFAKTKELDPNLNFARLSTFSKNGVLRITLVSLLEEIVTLHAYLVDHNERAVLLYSHHNISFKNNTERGFVNKFHHWMDLLYFKENEIKKYDMGGIDFENTPGIAEFKKSFGGVQIKSYNFQITSGLYNFLKK